MSWLLLLHQIPPKPPYFRAKILRRLAQVGALAVKNSAYLLPDTEETREDFEWILREITNEGGAAWLFRADALSGLSADQLVESFRQLRTADYEELIGAATELLADTTSPADHTKLTHRLGEVQKIDFFDHPLRGQAAGVIAQITARHSRSTTAAPATPGRVWVTRRDVQVDRIASAWLIRRFIDPQATFRFVDTATYRHAESECRFDMFKGEFTHEGNLCTFEVLLAAHGLAERFPALQPIAEMIHDIDLKDSRYERPETSGLARMLGGLCARTKDDNIRLDQGSQFFESLLHCFP